MRYLSARKYAADSPDMPEPIIAIDGLLFISQSFLKGAYELFFTESKNKTQTIFLVKKNKIL